MNVIFGRANVELLDRRYLALELETLHGVECFCVVPLESINDLSTLEHSLALHKTLVENVAQKQYQVCRDIIPHLMGKFAGELDSFYQEILRRCN